MPQYREKVAACPDASAELACSFQRALFFRIAPAAGGQRGTQSDLQREFQPVTFLAFRQRPECVQRRAKML